MARFIADRLASNPGIFIDFLLLSHCSGRLFRIWNGKKGIEQFETQYESNAGNTYGQPNNLASNLASLEQSYSRDPGSAGPDDFRCVFFGNTTDREHGNTCRTRHVSKLIHSQRRFTRRIENGTEDHKIRTFRLSLLHFSERVC